ncbi:hypothetical protein [Geomonas agri]|uniref:hypothetical protein n=1 Tax=Geomonas agri TaxID=2873702 RepID=UPI001CD34CFA|nr:hypothetical protein [Geomonas agri]
MSQKPDSSFFQDHLQYRQVHLDDVAMRVALVVAGAGELEVAVVQLVAWEDVARVMSVEGDSSMTMERSGVMPAPWPEEGRAVILRQR